MELFVNDSPVGVSPAESDTVDTLLRAVEKQLGRDLIIASLQLDGIYVSVDEPSVLARPVRDIRKAELIVATRMEIGISLLEDAKTLLISAAQELKAGASNHKKELMQGIAWIMESLDALRQSLPFPPSDLALLHGALADILRVLDTPAAEEDAARIAEALETLPLHFTLLQEKLRNPEKYTKENVCAVLERTRELLPKLSSCFQTGQDLEALTLLGGVIDAVDMYVRFSAQDKSNERKIFSEEINAVSSRLLEAFENKDYVLIADLIEYDLSDQLDAILEREQ